MHGMDLLRMALKGNEKASDALIKQQQSGRSLRLYPFGRRGADDEGMCVVKLFYDSASGNVIIRSGRPDRSVFLDKRQVDITDELTQEATQRARSTGKNNKET